jgi:hypothetical protein
MRHAERYALLSGEKIWPHDADQRSLIDGLRADAMRRRRLKQAAQKIQELHFDAFLAFRDALIRNFPAEARLVLVAKTTSENSSYSMPFRFCANTTTFLKRRKSKSPDDATMKRFSNCTTSQHTIAWSTQVSGKIDCPVKSIDLSITSPCER